MSDPDTVESDGSKGGDLRPGGPARRFPFHAGLSAIASPLPGGLLVASRLMSAGRPLAGLAALASAAGTTGAIVLAAFVLPVSAPVTGLALTLMAAGAGIATAWLEERGSVAPRTRLPGDRRLRARAALWGLVAPVVWIPAAWVIAILSSPWGPEAILKPSMQWRVLAAAALWLLPLGAAIGVARGLLERPFRIGAPLALAATWPAILLAVAPAAGILSLLRDVWLLPEVDAWSPGFGGDLYFLFDAAVGILVVLAAAEYLSDGTGLRAFLLRAGVLAGIAVPAVLHAGVVSSSLPVAARQRIAYAQAARGDDAAAARSWRWILRRAAGSEVTCRAVEQCALAALRAGRPQEAREALERIDARLLGKFPCAAAERLAGALLKSRLDVTGAVEADAPPVRPETYLDASWSAVLSAVRAALPDASEAQIKDRLRKLSTHPREIILPRLDGFDDLRLAARRLGCEAFAAPADRVGDLLAQGRPVLFRDPLGNGWGVIVWRAPAADAVGWLDYARWDTERERPLSGTELRQLLRGDDRMDIGRGAVGAEVRALESESVLRARLSRDGGWVAVVVAAPEGGRPPAPAGVEVPLGDILVRVWAGRHSVERGAYRIAAGLAAELPAGPAASEILAIGRAAADGRESPLPGPERPAAGERDWRDRITPDLVEPLSPWALKQIVDRGKGIPGLGCEVRHRALERLARDAPDDAELLEDLLDQALAAGSEREAVRVAVGLARARAFGETAVLRALEVIAPLAADHPEARAAVTPLLRRLPRLTGRADRGAETGSGLMRPRRSLAPYCAARAALAEAPRAAARWWRRAAEIDPLTAAYRTRLAESLEEIGNKEEAARHRREAGDLTGASSCAPDRLAVSHRAGARRPESGS